MSHYTNESTLTGTGHGAGDMEVKVLHGSTETTLAQSTFSANEYVADGTESHCYDDFESVQVKGTSSNGWGGIIRFSLDGGETFLLGTCTEGCSSNHLGTAIDTMFVDGDAGSGTCGGGNWCTITEVCVCVSVSSSSVVAGLLLG